MRLSAGHNCQGCGQRRLGHIVRPEPELESRGRVLSAVQRQRRLVGEGRVMRYSTVMAAWEMEIEGVKMLLGAWWMDTAMRGAVEYLPIVNMNPNEEVVETVNNTNDEQSVESNKI